MSASTRLHLRIEGRVQGVNFRYYARQRAEALGLSGWVRNCPGGVVEAEVEGPEDAVRTFAQWAHRGPPMARVERVHAEPTAPTGERAQFRILR